MGQPRTKSKLTLDQTELQKLEKLFEDKRFQKLDKRLHIHIKNHPNAFFLYNILGLSQSAQNKFHQAIESYRKVLEYKPDHASAYFNAGMAYMNLGNFHEALANFSNALELDSNLIGVYKNIGIACNNLEKFTEAIQYYQQALKQTPNDPEIYRNLGIANDNLSHYSEAQDYYEKALSLSPDDIECYNKYGSSYLKEGDPEGAVNVFLKGLERFPDNLALLINAGSAYNNINSFDKAVEYFQKAARLDATNPKVYSNLALALLNQEKYEQAINYFDHAIELNPKDPMMYYYKGTAYTSMGRDDAALPCYLETISLDPEFSQAQFYAGITLMQTGQPEKSISYYQKAIDLKPDFTNAYVNMGTAYKLTGDNYMASQIYQKAIELDEKSTLALRYFSETVRTQHQIKLTPLLRKHIMLCLHSPDVSSTSINPVANMMLLKDLHGILDADEITEETLSSLVALTQGLLPAYMKFSICTDFRIESFMTRVRHQLLKLYMANEEQTIKTDSLTILLEALAYQGFANEYIWYTSDEEEDMLSSLRNSIREKIKAGMQQEASSIFLLSSYYPLSADPDLLSWGLEAYENAPILLKDVLKKQVVEPARERELGKSIECLTSIDDNISSAVQQQYEENPYPRWDSLTAYISAPYISRIKGEIMPSTIELVVTSDEPEILIAGCGTGKHPISCALQDANSNVLAIDLSRASLSYALRKADELYLPNIKFAQADILKLGSLKKQFDIIECCGVLHHMQDPEAGLRVLLSLLKPAGHIKIALYSDLARDAVASLREKPVGDHSDTSLRGLQKIRYDVIRNSPDIHKKLSIYNDYYTASTFRDLVLHVQEHRFTIPQLIQLLERHSLEFLGFTFTDPRIKLSYKQMFAEDADCINLSNWDEFEKLNPQTFAGMYTFWCRKS